MISLSVAAFSYSRGNNQMLPANEAPLVAKNVYFATDDGGNDDTAAAGDAYGEADTASDSEVAAGLYPGLAPTPAPPDISDADARAAYKAQNSDVDSSGNPVIPPDQDPNNMSSQQLTDNANSMEPPNDDLMFPPGKYIIKAIGCLTYLIFSFS
jgi:hypothetical protein